MTLTNEVVLLGKSNTWCPRIRRLYCSAQLLRYLLFSFIAPSRPPVIVMSPTFSSRSITVNWTEIPCIQCNERLIRYEVPSGEGNISWRSFTANRLTPFTNYTFKFVESIVKIMGHILTL